MANGQVKTWKLSRRQLTLAVTADIAASSGKNLVPSKAALSSPVPQTAQHEPRHSVRARDRAVVAVTLLIVAVAAASSGACCRDAGAERRAAMHDVELALGAATLMTYEQAAAAAAAMKGRKAPRPSPEGKAEGQRCAMCQSEYASGDELVRVVPACGHFFHAGCDVDRWLREHRRCPICRGGLWPLPRPPRPECPPKPPRARVASPYFNIHDKTVNLSIKECAS
ncbi:hypothetical protein EJB05_05416, partial [Eragrostis curvula]